MIIDDIIQFLQEVQGRSMANKLETKKTKRGRKKETRGAKKRFPERTEQIIFRTSPELIEKLENFLKNNRSIRSKATFFNRLLENMPKIKPIVLEK